MMFGIAQMPYEMAMGDELSRLQFYANTQRMLAELNDASMALELLHQEHESLLRRVADAPVARMGDQGVLYGQNSPLEELSGQRVRILAEPGEVDRG